MRFGQKIFLIVFILVIVAINIIGILMINNSYKTNIEIQIDKGIMQINTIVDNLDLYNSTNQISRITNQYQKSNISMEIYIDNNMIYTNMEEDYSKIKEKLKTDENKIQVYISSRNIFITMTKEKYCVFTKTDLSELYKIKENQMIFFTRISLICSLIIACILYIGVFLATRKIKILNKAAKQIAKGNYNIEVKKAGKDEISELAETFNNMAISIKEKIEEINEVSTNRKNFISNLTHEIRTPLTSIIGYSSLIKNRKITQMEKTIDYSEKIYQEGNYIKEISDKLVDIILLDNIDIELKRINLSEELCAIIEVLQDTFKDTKFDVQLAKKIYIKSDKTLLKSLITNIVKNSINAYDENPIVRIELNQNAIIKIIDYGRGIPKEEIEKIKDPFYTLNKDRNREVSGMGLGIPLCMKILKMHNGVFDIKSKVNKGTEVIIKLGDKYEE